MGKYDMENLNLDNGFEISDILRKYVQHQPLAEQETKILEQWLTKNERNRHILESLDNEDKLASLLQQFYQTDTQAQLAIVNRRITQNLRIKQLKQWMSIAALLAVVFGISLWIYNGSRDTSDKADIQLTSVHGEDMLPGTNKAMLTLSSGQTIKLDEDKSGIVSTTNGFSYEDGANIGILESAQYATLSTPIGGQYKITLPDGSIVWMNAGSSLEYPLHFTGNQRQVKLKGEAFFDVKRDVSKPFIVQTAGQQINVLGTTFNVKAYVDETKTTTTLLTGLVRITMDDVEKEGANNNHFVMLHPGQQAVQTNGQFTVDEVATTYAVAWKDGNFTFRNESLANVMKQLQRWYGFSVDYDKLPKLHFTGGIKRDVTLSQVLNMLEETSTVRFQIKNKHVSIIKN